MRQPQEKAAMAITDGRTFGQALCDAFGLPRNQVMEPVTVHTARDEIFGVTFTLALTPQNLEEIGRRMGKPKETER